MRVKVSEDLVGLRGTDLFVFRRNPTEPWRVDSSQVGMAMKRLGSLGYEISESWRVDSMLAAYLLDLEYFYPGAIPSAWFGLVQALKEDSVLPGETLTFLHEPSYDRYGYARQKPRAVLQDQRVSRREIEQLVRQELKLDLKGVALRPLVGTTENAARAQWHYGMWGIYLRASGRPDELIAIHGHRKGGFGDDTWIMPTHDDSPWWAPSLRDYARIGCAITGTTLFEWGTLSKSEDGPSAGVFVEGAPNMQSAGGHDDVVLVSDPVSRPSLTVVR